MQKDETKVCRSEMLNKLKLLEKVICSRIEEYKENH